MVFELTKYLDSISPLLLVLYLLLSRTRMEKRDYLFWFLLAQTLINGYAIILDQLLDRPNLYLYHANCALSFLILSAYFRHILTFGRAKSIVFSILFLFSLFFIVNLLLWEDLSTFNSNSFGLASLILVAYCFLYYLENLIYPKPFLITKTRNFWFVTGILTYYASSFFIFITYRSLTEQEIKDIGILWQIHNVVFLVLCVYLLIGYQYKPWP